MSKHKLWPRNGVYYAWILGKRVSTGCRDKKAAQLAADELERAAVDPKYQAAHNATFGAACQTFKEELELLVKNGKRSSETVDFYSFKLAHLVRIIEADRPMSEITPGLVGSYLKKRTHEGAHPSSLNKELIALRRVLKYARRDGTFVGDVEAVMPIGFDHEYEPRKTFLSPDEAWALLGLFVAKRKGASVADGVLLAARTAFFLATACRDGELARARREDVDLSTWLVTIRGTKTKKSARVAPVVLPECQRMLVGALMAPVRKDGLLFGRWHNPVRDLALACKLARVPRVTPNDLRRTHAHWLRASGIDPRLIAPVMGHVDSRMVEKVYGRLEPEELRDELAKRLVQNQSNVAALAKKPGKNSHE